MTTRMNNFETNLWDITAHDYVTTVTARHPINKEISIKDNQPHKKPAKQVSEGMAQTLPVKDLQAFRDILNRISDRPDTYLILGFIKGTENGKPYKILSQKLMKKSLGISELDRCPSGIQHIAGELCATRTKVNFTSSSIIVFDYDQVAGMPDSLRTDDPEIWRGWMIDLLTGLNNCGYLLTPSTTSRILMDGRPAFPEGGWHMYIQTKDGSDVERFGRDLLIYAQSTDYGFMRPIRDESKDKVLGFRPWLITDPTTFSPERAIFGGRPVVKNEALSVSTSNILFGTGGRYDTSNLSVPNDLSERVKKMTGFKVERVRSGNHMVFSLVNRRDLTLDTLIQTSKGMMTVADYWKSDHGKLRAQAPFRPDSKSEAAFINRHNDGTPFVYDVGIQTKYLLESNAGENFQRDLAINWIESSPIDVIKINWTSYAVGLSAMQQEEIRQAVFRKTGSPLRVLALALREANNNDKELKAEHNLENEQNARIENGRIIIRWIDDLLNEVVRDVKKAVLNRKEASPIFNYGGIAVTVKIGHPTSVRQIQQKHELGTDYPEQYVTFQHTPITMQMRIQESVSFQNKRGNFIGCPYKVSGALLDDPSFAPPLAGLLEVPSVTPSGRLLNKPGYDRKTGFFMVFDKKLGQVNERANKDDALNSIAYIKKTVFAGFPFANDLDTDCAVAFLMTAFVRRFLSKAPGFMVNATTQASGKSTLVDIVFHASFGRPAAASSWSSNQEEMQKHITSILLEGHSGVNFDNLPYGCRVDGDELAKLLTQPTYSARLLGSNRTVSLPTNSLISMTGNHLLAVNDMPSRLVTINLEPQMEHPERTRYQRPNIDAWHNENRADIVKAVCSIFIAWRDYGEKTDIEPSRFPDWDDAVRQPLAWLGLGDASAAFEQHHNEDPARETRTKLLHAWFKTFGDDWVELSEFVRHYRWPGDTDSELSDALQELFEDGMPDARRIGLHLRFFKGNVYDGLRLEQQSKRGRSKSSRPWRVIKLT